MALNFLNDGYFAGKVGIGTVSPTEKLQVYEGGLTAYKSYTATNAGAILTAYQSTFSPFTKTTDLVAGSDGTVPSEIRFLTRTSGTSTIDERVRITSTGKVGIGTESPDGELEIITSSIVSGASDTVNNVLIGLQAANRPTIILDTADTTYTNRTWNITNVGSAGKLFIGRNGLDVMVMDNSGNVGIGTASPSQKLHVAGNARVTGAYYDSNNSPGTANQVLVSTVTGTDWIDGSAIPGVPSGSGAAGQVTVWSGTDVITGYTRFKVYDAGGQIQITDGTRDIRINSGYAGSTAMIGTSSSHDLGFMTGNSQRVTIDTSGNVGIGTTSPGAKLDVNGDVYINSNYPSNAAASDLTIGKTTTGDHGLTIVTGASNTAGIFFADNNNNDAGRIKYQHSSNSMRFDTNRSEAMRIDSSGNVGIGTTGPLEPLSVFAGTNESVYDVLGVYNSVTGTSAAGKGAAIRIGKDVDGNYSTKIATIYEDNNPSFLQPAMAFFTMRNTYLKGSEVERMRITSAGGISFGSTGTAYGTSGQVLTSAGNASPTWTTPTTGTVTGGGSNTYLAKWTTATNINSSAMFQAASGNFSIGITTPNARLSVQNDISIGTSATDVLRLYNNSGVGAIDGYSTRNLAFGSATNGEVMRIDNTNGRVGIGTTSPDHLLDLYKSTATSGTTTGTTLQRLWNYVGSDINQQKTFIDFVFQDDNTNEYPQVRIGAEVGQNGNANTQEKEGSGAFVVYTNNATGIGPGTPTGLAERFRVDYAGNVGIGTTSPSEALNIGNNGNIRFDNNGSGKGIIASSNGSNNTFSLTRQDSVNTGDFSISGYSGVGLTGGRTSSPATSGYHLYVASNGNVGIGTNSPSATLDVQSVTGTLRLGNNIGSVATGAVVGKIEFSNVDTSIGAGVQAYIQSRAIDNGATYAMDFFTGTKDNPTQTSLSLYNGNVGIGTTGPTSQLQVGPTTSNASRSLIASLGGTENGVLSALSLVNTSGNDVIGYGVGIDFHLASTYSPTGRIATIAEDTGVKAGMAFYTYESGNIDERIRISSAGAIKFNAYDSTNNTGTPTYLLGTDASGNVVKTNSAPSPITSQAASLYDLIPNGAFTTTYAFTSTAGTYAEVMSGDDVITAAGTYSVQMYVNDFSVGGTQYREYYSGVMSWNSPDSTNDTGIGAVSEIVLHRAGHAANQGIIYLRTRETGAAGNNELKLEIMCNRTYTGASNVVFKFVRLI